MTQTEQLSSITTQDDPFDLAQGLSPTGGNVIALGEGSGLPAKQTAFSDQIVTAQAVAVKRDLVAFLNRMKVLAQMAGEEYRYSFPVKSKDGSKKVIEGGSIKLANDLVREYGNCLVDVRVIDKGNEWEIYARFVDYETGFAMTRPYRQRKSQKTMGNDAERQLDIAYQIGVSKAIRNVVLNALSTFQDMVYDAAKTSLVEKIGKQLPQWKERIKQRCDENRYDLSRIERMVTKLIDDWTATDIARVVAELKSVQDGMATFDDLYPDPAVEEQQATTTTTATSLVDQFTQKLEDQNSQPTQATFV